MAIDLTTTYAGVSLKNFLIAASGPPTHDPETCERNAKAGFGAVVLKTGRTDIPESRMCKVGSPMVKLLDPTARQQWKPVPPKKSAAKILGKRGKIRPDYSASYIFQTSPHYYNEDPDYIDFYTETYKRCEPYNCKVIPSIYAGSWSGWERQIKMINKMQPKPIAVELNTSCPVTAVITEIAGLKTGMCIAAEPEIFEQVVKFCVDRLDVPAVPKLIPYESRNPFLALAADRAGAKGVNLGNASAVPSLTINVEDATVGEEPTHPTFSLAGWGAWIIPVNCYSIWSMRKNNLQVDIAATGGVREPEDVIKYIMAGANAVEICSAIWVEGFSVGTRLLDSIAAFMEKKGYKSIKDMRGNIVNKVVTDLSKFEQRVPLKKGGTLPPNVVVLDERKCIDCGWCEAGCMFLAIEIVDGVPKFDQEKCETCSMCIELCPVGALSISPREANNVYHSKGGE